MLSTTLLLAFLWGIVVAAFLSATHLGRWMRERLNWFVTSTGCGVDLLLLLLLADGGQVTWWHIPAVFFASSVPIAAMGVAQFHAYWEEMQRAARGE